MQEALHPRTIDDLLGELEQALAEERKALIKVDTQGIERTAETKSALSDALSSRVKDFTQVHHARLRSIHQDVRHNIILLVHAREYVRTNIALVTGQVPSQRPFAKPTAEAVRLDVRG